MKRIRTGLAVLALGVISVALVACGNASADGNTLPTEAPATRTPDASGPGGPDTPVSPGDPTPAPTDTPDWGHERAEELAPIESIEVVVRESFPPQYGLHIVSGLPSGCAAFERTEVEREGNTFTVQVVNTMPAPGQDVACTMIYGYHEQAVTLEDIEPGVQYTVDVNGESLTFTGQ